MKKLARKLVATILGYQVRRLCQKNNIKVVGVAGSIGKTSTKLAIAQVLTAGLRVRYQEGNYNDLVTVPLVFFGQEEPALYNPLAWLRVFWLNQRQLGRDYPYDVVVIELGSDGPGQVAEFGRYLNLEIGVLTAITPEHMAFFGSLDEVAKEELSIAGFSSLILANGDLCDPMYLKDLPQLLTYGLKMSADYNFEKLKIDADTDSKAKKYSILAAAAVATKLGLASEVIKKGLESMGPVSGRMQWLEGVNGSTIIDDSYNASPAAVKMALDALYTTAASQKIAVLGNMNELGDFAEQAHKEIGDYCDPKQLELVVTIGPDANKYLAASASKNGCKVHSFDSPYDIGEFLKPVVKKGAVTLVKGSQNNVFAEEAIKSLLADPADASKLVRQTPAWMEIKRKAFRR